jgi:hypothetical protein
MGWHSPFCVGTIHDLMHRWILATTEMLALVVACPGVARAQAEEAPPAADDNLPGPAIPQASTLPVPAPTTPAVPQRPEGSPFAGLAGDHRLVLIPYFGFNLPEASAAKGYAAGFRLGGLAGWSLTPRFSVNGEVTLDFMDGETDASIVKPHEYYLDLVLSPLFHLRSGRIVFGPKLGWFTNHRSFSDSDSAPYRDCIASAGSRADCAGPSLEAHSGQGILFGLNAGGFAPFGKLAIGLLASASIRHFTTVDCGPTGCVGDHGLMTILSLALAALF